MNEEHNLGELQDSTGRLKQTVVTIFTGVVCFLAILVLVFRLVVPLSGHGPARESAAVTQLAVFGTALKAYSMDTGEYPIGSNALLSLIHAPPGVTNWRGPYIQDTKIPKDPWGREYIYTCPGSHVDAGYPYDLVCLGPPKANAPIANYKINFRP